jgi:carboxypeptidase Q
MGRLAGGLLGFALLFSTLAALAQTRGPSTPEERARVVALVEKLQSNPIDPQLQSERQWALRWLIEVPDVSVTMCSDLLKPVLGSKYKYEPDLIAFHTLASAAFVIKNPGANLFTVNKAALESTLAAYQAILQAKPKATLKGMDALVQMKINGELDKFVQRATDSCSSGDQRASVRP